AVPAGQHGFALVITSGRGGLMVRLKSCCAVAPALSWTWIVNVVACTVTGVPVMVTQCTPHWRGAGSVSPAGGGPATRVQGGERGAGGRGSGGGRRVGETAGKKTAPGCPAPGASPPRAPASPPVLIASGDPVTVSTADTLTPPAEAVIVTSVLAGTATGVVTG